MGVISFDRLPSYMRYKKSSINPITDRKLRNSERRYPAFLSYTNLGPFLQSPNKELLLSQQSVSTEPSTWNRWSISYRLNRCSNQWDPWRGRPCVSSACRCRWHGRFHLLHHWLASWCAHSHVPGTLVSR
jgi:hypothetical protein